jgi:hypothetical protein
MIRNIDKIIDSPISIELINIGINIYINPDGTNIRTIIPSPIIPLPVNENIELTSGGFVFTPFFILSWDTAIVYPNNGIKPITEKNKTVPIAYIDRVILRVYRITSDIIILDNEKQA